MPGLPCTPLDPPCQLGLILPVAVEVQARFVVQDQRSENPRFSDDRAPFKSSSPRLQCRADYLRFSIGSFQELLSLDTPKIDTDMPLPCETARYRGSKGEPIVRVSVNPGHEVTEIDIQLGEDSLVVKTKQIRVCSHWSVVITH